MNSEYYEILEVSKSSSKDEIKKSYRRLAMKYHPDRNAWDKDKEDKFKKINEAYSTLSDDQKRAQEASQARMKAKELNKAGASGGGLNIKVSSEISTSQGLSASTSTRVNPTGNLKGQNKGLAR